MNVEIGTSIKVGSGTTREAPRLVEIVGPAGAGKTTLCQALLRSSDRVRQASFPDVRSPRTLPFFLLNGYQRLGNVGLLAPQDSRRLTAREFAWLCILNGWPRLLQSDWESHHRTVLLDQGPVYLFSELRETGPRHLQAQLSNGTCQELYDRWAAALDAIIRLDAPDEVLVERIYRREKDHVVKGQPASAVLDFLRRFRSTYEHTLSMLAARNPGLNIIRLDTSMQTPDEIARELVAALNL